MELNEYQKSAISICADPCKNASFFLLSLVGKVGNFSTKLARQIRKGKMRIMNNHLETLAVLRVENYGLEQSLKQDAGYILNQLSNLCSIMGWNLEDIAKMNLDKIIEGIEQRKNLEESENCF